MIPLTIQLAFARRECALARVAFPAWWASSLTVAPSLAVYRLACWESICETLAACCEVQRKIEEQVITPAMLDPPAVVVHSPRVPTPPKRDRRRRVPPSWGLD